MTVRPWHAHTPQSVLAAFSTDPAQGLSAQAALNLSSIKGENKLPAPERPGALSRVVNQLKSPIALILLVAALATFALSHVTDAVVILVALLVNVVMGLVQEGRASRAFEALQAGEAKTALVVRDGAPTQIPAEQVVPGDLIVLSSGSRVPADLRIVEAHGLSIDESALSGEWLPVEKGIEEVAEAAPLVERTSMAYAGTLVSAGAGRGIVVAIGGETELGRIALSLEQTEDALTPLARDIRQVARLLLGVVLAIVLIIFLLGALRDLPLSDTVLTAIALAVATVPEGLPAAVTVVLALGMERILRAGGLVRSLLAAETLGTTSIILTDKTGTLTEGKMRLERFYTATTDTTDAQDGDAYALLTAALLASSAHVEAGSGSDAPVAHGRPVEAAITLSALTHGLHRDALLSDREVLDELHFDSARRFGGRLVRENGTHVAYITGAPELFEAAMETQGKAVHARYLARLKTSTRAGDRIIGAARIETKHTAFPSDRELPAFLASGTFLGLMAFSDTIRPEAKAAIKAMQDAGARVLMLTGDNPGTALSIATTVGIAAMDARAYTGAELASVSDAELLQILRTNTVFARVAPADKLRIAQVLTKAGEVVAMTGDGVNDAPALRAASIGIALGSGTDVAKEASDLVLLKNGFSVITKAIQEGRRLRDNFKKIFAYMLSTNASEVALITFALAFGLPLPILPTQILWSNLIEGGLMNFAFAFEPLYPESMKRNPKDPENARVLSPRLLKLIGVVGLVTSFTLISVYLYLYFATSLEQSAIQTLMFIAVSVNCIFMAFSMKSLSTPLWRISPWSNRFLLVALAIAVLLLFAALYVPGLQAVLSTETPTLGALLLLFGFGLLNLLTIELAKWLVFIRPARKSAILQA